MSTLRSDLRTVARGWRWTHRPPVPRSAAPFVPEVVSREFPTGWARGRAGTAVREGVQRAGLAPLIRAEVRPQVEGLDVLEGLEMPVIFVANHTSHLDTPLILCSLPHAWRRRTAVAAAADYFFDSWWRAVGSALVFNTFPIERRAGTVPQTPSEVLADGWNVVVFPEGTRSPDGTMQRFRAGAAWFAATHGVAVVPVGIRGSFAAMPRGRGWPVPGRPVVRVRYGGPMRLDADGDVRAFGAAIKAEVRRLVDEDETTWWESLRRAALDEPEPERPAAHWRRVWASSEPPAGDPPRRAWSG